MRTDHVEHRSVRFTIYRRTARLKMPLLRS